MALTSPGLIAGANTILTKIAPEIELIKTFAYDCSDAIASKGRSVLVKVVDGGTANAYNLDNSAAQPDYEANTGILSDVNVVLANQPTATIEIDGKDVLELATSPYWDKFAKACANSIATAIQTTVGGLITTDLTKASTVFGVEGTTALTKGKVAKLRSDCVGRVGDTVLVLDPVRFNEALELFGDTSVYGSSELVRKGIIPELYGFRACMQMKGLPEGVQGALIPVDSVAIAARAIAVGDEDCYSEYGTITDENGFPVTVMRHGSPRYGKGFINVGQLFGATLAKPSEIKFIAAS